MIQKLQIETNNPTLNESPFQKVNLYVQCSKNNTRLTLTTLGGDVIYTITPSHIGFKKTLRSTPNNAYEITLIMVEKIKSFNIQKIENVFLKGIGPGRNQVLKALTKASFLITQLIDITTFPFNGCRPKKARRLKRLT